MTLHFNNVIGAMLRDIVLRQEGADEFPCKKWHAVRRAAGLAEVLDNGFSKPAAPSTFTPSPGHIAPKETSCTRGA